MKKTILVFAIILTSYALYAQEGLLSVSYGYEFANVENFEDQATGWRINAEYDFRANEGKFAHGMAGGYASLSVTEESLSSQGDKEGTFSTVPIYYVPKFFIGKGKTNLFIKGALGMQYSTLKREVAADIDINGFGFYGGGGAGLMVGLGEKLFINAEYEIAWVSNSWYEDGWLNSAMIGLGIKF
jgi:hypothetical protein